MTDLGVIFLTGLTTGGLSCLAVQGGLLASSVAKQAEDDLLNTPPKAEEIVEKEIYTRGPEYVRKIRELQTYSFSKKRYHQYLQSLKFRYPKQLVVRDRKEVEVTPQRHTARPIVLFLSAKVTAYTLLGALLGAVGSVIQLTPYMRAGLQIAIGVYMLGLAMHLLNVHPIFRHFILQPPKALTRYIRRKAKSGSDDLVTPTFLGALTVFIPCGVTVAMMAIAVGTGNVLAGAAIMFAFTLGTTPLFFTLAYTALKLGARKQAAFLKFTAVVVLILGLVAIEGGLNLAGSPISYANFRQSLREKSQQESVAEPTQSTPSQTAPSATPSSTPATEQTDNGILRLSATNASYSPSVIKAKAGKPYKLEITSQENQGCGRAFTIPSLGLQKTLPENGVTIIDLPAQKPGTMRMTCSMGMYRADIKFES